VIIPARQSGFADYSGFATAAIEPGDRVHTHNLAFPAPS